MCFGPLCNRSDRKVRQERKERDRAINSKNKIEEIGTDITSRMSLNFHGGPIGPIIDKSSEATKLQKSIYRRISKELWGTLISREQLKNM